mmetsp:Transcript_51329/g.164870  ORF Transcript_51329/g.164870 Transcript_51329/m.164870 type:complete len:90 (+) Transcript_51329:1450-1719(+)
MQLRAVTCKQSPNWIGSGCFPNEKRLQVHCGQVFSGLHHWSARLMRSSERTDVQSSAGRILYLALGDAALGYLARHLRSSGSLQSECQS